MKTCLLCFLPFGFCLTLSPVRAADAAPAPASSPVVELPKVEVNADLPKRTDPLIDPLTGTPYVAVHNGDIVESVIFTIEFQRAHPNEHAFLLTKEIEKYFQNGVESVVAFSWARKVYIHSQTLGDFLVPGVLPEQIDGNKRQLENVSKKALSDSLKKFCAKQGLSYPLSQRRAYEFGKADAFPHVLPSELPGDTEDIQAKRVEDRLKKLGLLNTRVYYHLTGVGGANEPITFDRVVFDYGDFEYAWAKHGDKYLGFAQKTYLPSLIDSIVFSIDYQKANPSEKVICFLHETANQEPPARGDMVATTIYTKSGRLWFHHLAPGALPSALTLKDLKDSDKVIYADLAAYYPALKKFDEQESHLRHQSPIFLGDYLKGYKAPDLSVTGVLAELQKRGVEAKITGDADNPALLFVWGKRPFTYQPGMGCYPAKSSQITATN